MDKTLADSFRDVHHLFQHSIAIEYECSPAVGRLTTFGRYDGPLAFLFHHEREGTLDYEIYLNTKRFFPAKRISRISATRTSCNSSRPPVEEMWMKLIGIRFLILTTTFRRKTPTG